VVLGSGELGLLLGLVGVGLGAEVPLSEGLGVEVAEALWLTVGLTLADDEELVSVALAEGLRLGAVVEVGTMLALAEAEVVPDLLECDVAVALALAGADGALALAGVDVAWPLADVAGELADAWCWLARCFFAGVTTESTRIAALGRLEHAPFTIGGPPTRS
jgi:hypothetical protein